MCACWFCGPVCVCVCFGFRNLRILQKSLTASGQQLWEEKALCLGSSSSCGSTLVGHIQGFGEDELGALKPMSQWHGETIASSLRKYSVWLEIISFTVLSLFLSCSLSLLLSFWHCSLTVSLSLALSFCLLLLVCECNLSQQGLWNARADRSSQNHSLLGMTDVKTLEKSLFRSTKLCIGKKGACIYTVHPWCETCFVVHFVVWWEGVPHHLTLTRVYHFRGRLKLEKEKGGGGGGG